MHFFVLTHRHIKRIFLEFDGSSQYVLDKCNEPCLKMLTCGDLCSGTCGKCKQGRLHVPCEEMCNKINPCNHTCVYTIHKMYSIYIHILIIKLYNFKNTK